MQAAAQERMQTCLDICFCSLFSSSEQFPLGAQSISLCEPSSDSVTIQSLREHRGYIPCGVLCSRMM